MAADVTHPLLNTARCHSVDVTVWPTQGSLQCEHGEQLKFRQLKWRKSPGSAHPVVTHTHTRENKSVFEERSQPQLQLLHTFTEYLLWILTQPPLKCQDFCWVMCLSGTEIKHSTCEHFNLSPCFTALRPNCYFTVFLITGYLSASVTMTVRCRMFKPIPNFWMGFWDGRKHRTFYYSSALFLAWLLSNTSTGGQCWHLFFKVNIIEKYLIV